MGRIRNDKTNRIKKSNKDARGYLRIRLGSLSGWKTFKVHRLVATAFIPQIEGKPEVNHIDGDKTNNHVDNLEWVNHSENQLHACHKLGKVMGDAHMKRMAEASGKKRRKPVMCVETGEIFVSTRYAGIAFNISHANIVAVLHGRQKTAGGYHWKYIEEGGQ